MRSEKMSEKKWYVIHTYAGYENKVKANLEKRVESMEMQDKIFRVLILMEKTTEFRDGKRKVILKKVFPGYVLVEMLVEDDSWYVVRNTPGVTGFVGSGNKPVPLSEEESSKILRQMGITDGKLKVDFSLGESIQVKEGPFTNFIGKIDDINAEKSKLKVLVSMFGRETPVELEFHQVEKM